MTRTGIIGGTGLESGLNYPHLEVLGERSGPFGRTLSPFSCYHGDGHDIVFVARHGSRHEVSPTQVNYRAIIYAMKELEVEQIIALSACGSLCKEIRPGEFVIPRQFYDSTKLRATSFFSEGDLSPDRGPVVHVPMAYPIHEHLATEFEDVLVDTNPMVKFHTGRSCVTIEGPRFNTHLESLIFKSWGLDIVNMTACPEVFLAREANIPYVMVNHVTDYDCWRMDSPEDDVSVAQIQAAASQNVSALISTIAAFVSSGYVADPYVRQPMVLGGQQLHGWAEVVLR